LPPVNKTAQIDASLSMLSTMTFPLAESGYYVMPVALVNEMFKHNCLTSPEEIRDVPLDTLRNIFGVDAALYTDITSYSTTYKVLDSITTVTANAKLVDLKHGEVLWTGSASASSAEQNNNNNGGLAGMLISALVKQIAGSVSDESHRHASLTSNRLLGAGRQNGVLYGPRSPQYGQDAAKQ